jgi:integrase
LQEQAHVLVGDLFSILQEWDGITWGMVYGFEEWMLARGYAMGTIDGHIGLVKKYMRLAYKAGWVTQEDIINLIDLKGHSTNDRINIDEKRPVTRIGTKKEAPTLFSTAHLRTLRERFTEQADTYIGLRDLLMLCLLGYHALRAIEIHDLERGNIDLATGQFTFKRRKVKLTDNHEMNQITLNIMRKYLQMIPATQTKLFLGVDRSAWIDKNGKEHAASKAEDGLSTRAINQRVCDWGESVDVPRLSPHDLRHKCVDDLATNGTPIELLKKFGGWKTFVMPDHYTRKAAITNKGISQTQW